MGSKTSPDAIGIGYRRVKVALDALPVDQWNKLVKIKVYVGNPTGLTTSTEVLKAAIGPDADVPSAGQKVAIVDYHFDAPGMYFVTTTLVFSDGKYLSQPVGNYDYLLATGIAEVTP
jgi:hypothetical protein